MTHQTHFSFRCVGIHHTSPVFVMFSLMNSIRLCMGFSVRAVSSCMFPECSPDQLVTWFSYVSFNSVSYCAIIIMDEKMFFIALRGRTKWRWYELRGVLDNVPSNIKLQYSFPQHEHSIRRAVISSCKIVHCDFYWLCNTIESKECVSENVWKSFYRHYWYLWLQSTS